MKTLNYNGRNHRVFTIECFGTEYEIILEAVQYRNPMTLAVQALNLTEDRELEPFGILSVNMAPNPESALQDDTHAFLKTWSENSPWARRVVEENGLAKPTGDMAFSGYVCAPLYEWDIHKFYAD